MNNPTLNFTTWLLSSIFYAFQMVLRILPVLLVDHLSNDLGMTIGEIGFLSAIYYLGYASAHIPVGIAFDIYRARNIIFVSILLCICGIYFTSFATTHFEIYISRLIIGFGSVAGFLGVAKVTTEFYSNRFGLMLGSGMAIGFIGALYGSEPFKAMMQAHSFEQAMQSLALFAIILASCIWAIYKAKPIENTNYKIVPSLKKALATKELWILGILGGLLIGPLEGFAGIWGMKYLSQIHDMRDFQATYSVSLILAGAIVGFPMIGLLAKYLNLRKLAMSLGCINLVILFLLLGPIKLEIDQIFILCFLIGLCTTHEICIFVNLTKRAKKDILSLSRAIVNMVIMSFGFIYYGLIGLTLSYFPSDNYIYSEFAYRSAFGIMIFGITIGIFGFYKTKVFD